MSTDMDIPIKPSNNTEIEQALKEFEKSNSAVSLPDQSISKPSAEDLSTIIKLVIKLSGGLIKTKKQANYVLLVISVISISVSVFLVWQPSFVHKPIVNNIPPYILYNTPPVQLPSTNK